MSENGKAKQIMNYSFLVAFANDGTLDSQELEFMKKLALRDGVVDDEEKTVLQKIFDRAYKGSISEETKQEIESFRKEFDI